MRRTRGRSLRRRVCVSLLLALVFGVSHGARAVDVMLVYNSVDQDLPHDPGRYVSPTTTLKTTSSGISDDYQCGGVDLAPVYLYIARADGTAATSAQNVCSSGEGDGDGDEVCGFDLTVSMVNVSAVSTESFRIQSFAKAVNDYSIESNLSEDGETLRINGVNTAGPYSLPVSVGQIDLERADGQEVCPSSPSCDAPWCGSLLVSSAKIVRADLAVEELNDTVPLLRLPEPAGDAMWWAGVMALLGLSRRRATPPDRRASRCCRTSSRVRRAWG